MSVLFATLFSLGLITVDFHRGHTNIDVRNTFRKRSYDIMGIVLASVSPMQNQFSLRAMNVRKVFETD